MNLSRTDAWIDNGQTPQRRFSLFRDGRYRLQYGTGHIVRRALPLKNLDNYHARSSHRLHRSGF
jgi:hypothetical protein